MKQATESASSALDLRQTTFGGDTPPFDAAKESRASSASNKSRARSCYGGSPASSTFKPAQQAGRSLQVAALNASPRSTLRSERPFNRCLADEGESFESQARICNQNNHPHSQSLIHNHQEQIELYNETDCSSSQQLIHQQTIETSKQQQHQLEGRVKMSQTIQSIQSLSMQLNRATSLSTSLDDAMSVSQELSAGQAGSSSNEVAGRKKLSKLVGKKAGRMKEVLLQNLGKAHKTTDELFEMYEENFYKQQAQAVKIQKEFKSYMGSLKGAQDAGKSLNICIQQSTGVYQSARHDLVCENLSQLDILNEDLLDKLRGQIQVSLSEYMSQFSDLREKILKRKRKLIDYDSSRRVYEIMLAQMQRKRQTTTAQQQAQEQQAGQQHYHGLRSLRPSFMMRSSSPPSGTATGSGDCMQSAASQLVDEARLLKLREQYNYCKIMFETINSELYQELPMVYEKKMKHLLMTLQNYFSLEAQFHSNAGKLYATAGDVIDELPMSIHRSQQQNPLSLQRQQEPIGKGQEHIGNGDDYINHKASGSSGMGSSRGDSSLESSSSPDSSVNGSSSPANAAADCCARPLSQSVLDSKQASKEQQKPEAKEEPLDVAETGADLGKVSLAPEAPSIASTIDEIVDGGDISCQLDSLSMDFGDSSVSDSVVTGDLEPFKPQLPQYDDDEDDDQQASTSEGSSCSVIEVKPEIEKVSNEAAGAFLYKVKTSYKYLAEDVDELCFEADEIIQVVEFEENQEQEEGWLMGVREVNGQRGLFPANFTKPIGQLHA